MAGTLLLSPDWSIIEILLQQTPVGLVLMVRAAALALIFPLLFRRGGNWAAIIALPAAIAAATLAWLGHAAASEGWAGSAHRFSDALHVLAASGWLGALLALLHAVIVGRQPGRNAAMLERFSIFGTLFVATLILTGAINTAMILGLNNLPAILHSLYGWLLLAKLSLFAAMLLLAAANRWRLTPRLEAAVASGNKGAAFTHLRLSLLIETGLGLAVLALVAALGTLDPLA